MYSAYVPDGYYFPAHVAAAGITFWYRPLLEGDQHQYLSTDPAPSEAQRGKRPRPQDLSEEESVAADNRMLADRIVHWDYRDHRGTVLPIEVATFQRTIGSVRSAMVSIVCGYMKSDPLPSGQSLEPVPHDMLPGFGTGETIASQSRTVEDEQGN